MRRALLALAIIVLARAGGASAQEAAAPPVDSLVVEGNARLTPTQILGTAGIAVGAPINYRDIQRAITALFATGQFDDVTAEQRSAGGRTILAFVVRERPVLARWAVRGPEKLSERTVRDRVALLEGRPVDRAAVQRSRASIDSLYRARGYYAARVKVLESEAAPGSIRIVFDVEEGSRVAIAQVDVEGNANFKDGEVVRHMASRPEGFLWFQKGEYDEEKLQQDMREKLPEWYGSKGYIDFQVTGDTLAADTTTGKATLRLQVEEGPQYEVGEFDVIGNRRYSVDELRGYYPFAPKAGEAPTRRVFSKEAWRSATEKVNELYANTGYIYAQVEPQETRRTAPDGRQVVDLRWVVREGQPATINKIEIVGNDVTHERVIREAIVMLPGDVFSRERLIRSYQNVSNLGFFNQPMPPPDVRPAANRADVDIVFRVEEKRTGNINFGASLGQGTGIGGFIGLEEPNLFGKAKRGRLNWQFGRNINNFTLSYTDPAIRESRISGTVTAFNSRLRYVVGNLGRQTQQGGSIQLGFPFFGARYTRLFGTYSYQRISYTEGSEDLRLRFSCVECIRSTLGMSVLRDTRIDLPFATAGTFSTVSVEQNGGILGGTGNYRKVDLEGRWYAPLGVLGGSGQFGGGIRFVLGVTARTGFILGDPGPFFTEMYSMGGVQFGIPLRGYEEFSITPNGYDLQASAGTASGDAFGKSHAAFTVEAGARISQALYANLFFDAGNVYRSVSQYDPTRLFRGAGLGVALVSPLGPIGIDMAYGFDRTDVFGRANPGWKLHFRLGNFF